MVLALAPPAWGWSYKEHVQLTRIAASRLLADPTTPTAMQAWLREAIPEILDLAGEREFLLHARVGATPRGFEGMLHWACMPDVRATGTPRDQKVEPFGVHERLLHFIDLELFQTGGRKRGYRHDLSGRPEIGEIPRDPADPRYQQAGMLPLRIEQCYQELVRSIREDRLHALTASEQEASTATFWAGYLAHYLADNTQPHHATVDYKSQSYFANPRRAPNVHAEVEYRMLDDEKQEFPELRAEYWSLFEAAMGQNVEPMQDSDPFRASLEVSFISYEALPLIGLAAMHAAGQGGTPDEPQGNVAGAFDTEAFMRYRGTYRGREMSVMEMKARQTAWAVDRIAVTLRQAWRDAKGE
jgi:hypothetical protein